MIEPDFMKWIKESCPEKYHEFSQKFSQDLSRDGLEEFESVINNAVDEFIIRSNLFPSVDGSKPSVDERINKICFYFRNICVVLEDISQAEAFEYHEDARSVLLNVLCGIRSFDKGCKRLQQIAAYNS